MTTVLKIYPGLDGTSLIFKDRALVGTLEFKISGKQILKTHPSGYIVGEFTSTKLALDMLTGLYQDIEKNGKH
jgi:hypothetical protein